MIKKIINKIFGRHEAKTFRKKREFSVPSYHKNIVEMAEHHGWQAIDWQDNIGLLSFAKRNMRINIYTTKMTVGTCLNHPKQGKTQLYRKNVDMHLLYKIFENPRTHTDKGYKTK